MDYSTAGFTEVTVVLDEAVLVVTMNRAKQRNTFNIGLVNELIKVFGLADADDRVRVVIMTASLDAPAYCSGADLSEGWKSLEGAKYATKEPGGSVSMAVLNCRKITIVAVNGHAAGAGMTAMQLPYDFRFVWEGAKLVFPFVRRGIAAEGLSSRLLPDLIGLSRAKAILLSGPVLSPKSPLLDGLYYAILPERKDVFPAALALAKELAANTSQRSIAYTKGMLNNPPETLDEVYRVESLALSVLSQSKDAAEAAKAFIGRRAPKMTDVVSNMENEWYPWWDRKAKL